MTAYGRAVVETHLGRFVVEILSVNRKYLEYNLSLPMELSRFETDIKKWLAEYVGRGQLTVRLSAAFSEESPVSVTPNIPLAKQIKSAFDAIAQELGITKNFTLDLLAQVEGVLNYDTALQNENEYKSILHQLISKAAQALVEMKLREGKTLHQDIEQRIGKLQVWIEQVENAAPRATQRYRLKLLERLEEVLPGAAENEEKILREVCVYAEKIDITEEITRFKSHLIQFSDLLAFDSSGPGKKLEFILQELNREANTIGSKASEIDVARFVIDIKSELEKIREQIQNVE